MVPDATDPGPRGLAYGARAEAAGVRVALVHEDPEPGLQGPLVDRPHEHLGQPERRSERRSKAVAVLVSSRWEAYCESVAPTLQLALKCTLAALFFSIIGR